MIAYILVSQVAKYIIFVLKVEKRSIVCAMLRQEYGPFVPSDVSAERSEQLIRG